MGNGNGGVWKWLAAFLAGLMIALVPSLWAINRAPSADQVERLQQQLELTQVQLARLEERQNSLLALLERHLAETQMGK